VLKMGEQLTQKLADYKRRADQMQAPGAEIPAEREMKDQQARTIATASIGEFVRRRIAARIAKGGGPPSADAGATAAEGADPQLAAASAAASSAAATAAAISAGSAVVGTTSKETGEAIAGGGTSAPSPATAPAEAAAAAATATTTPTPTSEADRLMALMAR
jgi:hypothetical protein